MEKQNAFRVLFAAEMPAAAVHDGNTIVFVPLESEWNDFGYKTRINFFVFRNTETEP
jgi:hypothetical protein